MSAAPDDYDPSETLSGDWFDVSIVEDVGSAEETETFLTRTSGEITISQNTNQWESEPNASRYRQSGTGHVDHALEIQLDHAATDDLVEAGVVDDNDERIYNTTHDAIRIYGFAEREDADDEQVIERELHSARYEEVEEAFPTGDVSTASLTFRIMGEILHAFTEEST